MSQPFRLRCGALPDGCDVVAFRGTEAISQLYEVQVHLVGGERTTVADLDRAVGEAATLEIGDDDSPLRIHGVVAEVELCGHAGSRPVACLTIVPRAWWLTQTLHSRVFTDRTIPDIVADTLRRGGLGEDDFVFELGKGYAPLEHVCQYRESDHDFIARWLEHEGIYFFYEQGETRERLVVTDDRACLKSLLTTPVRYVAEGAGVMTGQAATAFRRRQRALPGRVGLRAYDELHPAARLEGSGQVGVGGAAEVRDHHARFSDADRGARLATRRSEELAAGKTVCRLDATARAFRAGYLFTLAEHADADVNATYLVTRLEQEGVAADVSTEVRRLGRIDAQVPYRAEVSAVPASVPYRAPRVTPWPRITGHEIGVVDGPADGDYAQIDEHGRYKVKLHLDESDLAAGHASTWLRRMQPYAGSPEGIHFPLRKGTEVLVTFVGGDPDRPVIAGAVPNATTPSPVKGDNATSNVLHTAGGNHFELGDVRGGEFVTLTTPHKTTRLRLGAPAEEGGAHISLKTEGDSEEESENRSVTVHNDVVERIHGKRTETIYGSKEDSVFGFETGTVVGLKTEQLAGGEMKTVIGRAVDATIGIEDKYVVGGEVKVVIGLLPIASQINIIGGDNKNVLGPVVDNILGAEAKFVGGGVQETIVGGVVEVIIGGKNELVVGLETKTLVGGALELVTGVEEKVVLGGAVEIVAPVDMKVVLGALLDMVIGAEIGVVIGAKIDLVAGVTISEEEAKIHTLEARIEELETLVLNSETIVSRSGVVQSID
jgi:type VI secretion system secreted protein VgrG